MSRLAAPAPKPFTASDESSECAGGNTPHIAWACRELKASGVQPLLSINDAGEFTTGASLSIDVAETLASSAAVERLCSQAYDLLASCATISVTLSGLGAGDQAEGLFAEVCRILRAAAIGARGDAANVELVIQAGALAMPTACSQRREILGAGKIIVLADQAPARRGHQRQSQSSNSPFWLSLWQMRHNRLVQAAYAPYVSSSCSLLSTEAASCLLPSIGVQIPEGSAWIPMRLNLCGFANERGVLRKSALREALCRAVDIGELLHDYFVWPTAQLRYDAWLNRRLAILITGFGDLVRLRQSDPRAFSTLRKLMEDIAWIRSLLYDRSRQIARRTRHLPALDHCDPTQSLASGDFSDAWRERWQSAVDSAAIRHRNLLVMSPWSVFPSATQADVSYGNLLPLLRFADACAFSQVPDLSSWNFNEFSNFHLSARAIVEQKEARRLFAEQV